MSQGDVDFVTEVLGPFLELGEFDVKQAVRNESLFARLGEFLDPDASITFSGPGDMVGPFRGVEGFVAGWREWIAPWEEYRVVTEKLVDAGEGKVLLLALNTGRLEGGGEISQESAAIYSLAGDKVTAIDHYLDRDEARRALES